MAAHSGQGTHAPAAGLQATVAQQAVLQHACVHPDLQLTFFSRML